MLTMIAISLVMQVLGMAMQVLFLAVAAYWVAKMGRKGWNAGK